MSEIKRFTTTETAQLIRAALKTAFPAVKFSVRSKSYSGGSSINVSWIDGPTQQEVDRVSSQFSGATFDGMVDLKSYHVSTFEGQQVRFGADFVFANRTLSVDHLRRAIRYANLKYGWSVSTDVVVENGSHPYIASTPETTVRPFQNHYDVRDLVNQIAHSMRQDGIVVVRMNYPQPVEPVAVPDVVGDMKRADVARVVGELWKTGEEYHAGAIDEFSWKRRNRELWQHAENIGIANDVRDMLRNSEKESRHA